MDAGFTVHAYSVRRDEQHECTSVTLTDRDHVWRALVEFVPRFDAQAPTVQMADDHCGKVRMAADHLDAFVKLLRAQTPVYVAFSTDEDVFLVMATEAEEAEAA